MAKRILPADQSAATIAVGYVTMSILHGRFGWREYADLSAASQAFIPLVDLLISGIVQANTNLLNNGSFEIPSVPAGWLTNFTSGSSAISGWTVVGSETSVVSGKFTSLLFQFPASDASQWLDLTGYLSTSAGGVEQTVPTAPGKAYLLSFAVGNVFDPYGLYDTTSTVDVTVNGMALGTFTNSCTTCTKILT